MKKIFSLIIIAIIFVGVLVITCSFSYAASGDTGNIGGNDDKTYEDGYRDGLNDGYDDGYDDGIGAGKERVPVVSFIEDKEIQEVNAGETLNLTVNFRNSSIYNAKDLTITPDLEGTPLVYERPLKYKMTKTLKGHDESKTSFSIKVSENAKIGTYPVKFKIEYKNNRDEVFTREDVIYFKVKNEKLKPIITVSNIVNSLMTIKAGDTFNLSFDINNIGGSEAKEIEVLLEGFSQTSLMPIDAKDYNYVGTLKANETSKQSFDILTSNNINSENNVITVKISYKDSEGESHNISKNIYIVGVDIGDNVSEEEDEKAAKPKMIISSYGLNPTEVVAGDIFKLGFTFKNTSREKKIRNIKITISSGEGAFIITRGSNTFYIEEMDKQAMITREIELKAKQDLASNSYKVNIEFDYEDFSGNQYNSTETLNIPVTEYSKLVINSVFAGQGYVGSNTNLSFDYVNMGKATVSNLTASVEGDYESVQTINYIGNLNAGSSDYYDIEVRPTKEGMNYGTLVLAFEDSSGGIIEVRKEFEGNAFAENFFEEDPGVSMKPIDIPMEPAEEPGLQIPTWQIVLYGIGSFVIAFIITKIITTKIVRKKLEEDL